MHYIWHSQSHENRSKPLVIEQLISYLWCNFPISWSWDNIRGMNESLLNVTSLLLCYSLRKSEWNLHSPPPWTHPIRSQTGWPSLWRGRRTLRCRSSGGWRSLPGLRPPLRRGPSGPGSSGAGGVCREERFKGMMSMTVFAVTVLPSVSNSK